MLFILFWDKIYYTSIHKTNDPNTYFITNKIEKKLGVIEDEIKKDVNPDTETIITSYISFYNYCSQIIIFSNGTVKYVKKESKNSLKFVI